jgi:hypothetical protein
MREALATGRHFLGTDLMPWGTAAAIPTAAE